MNQEILQQYCELSPADKIRAILSAAREPISRHQVFLYGGIFDVLLVSEQGEVEEIFHSAAIGKKNKEDEELFQLSNQESGLALIGEYVISEYFLSLWNRRKGN